MLISETSGSFLRAYFRFPLTYKIMLASFIAENTDVFKGIFSLLLCDSEDCTLPAIPELNPYMVMQMKASGSLSFQLPLEEFNLHFLPISTLNSCLPLFTAIKIGAFYPRYHRNGNFIK